MERLFSVIACGKFFMFRHNPTGKERIAGDGQNILYDHGHKPIPPTTDRFKELWEEDINNHPKDILEDFFPELLHRSRRSGRIPAC